ncbi:hypothetical protein PALB_11240 [Pseudoalteromonas luteoviolacea B = ATCC 29581]|nr:hypothetical protein PALB_11240 [Pseudoalteromonas luteoviolacea B = ATCC 29581]
MKKIAVESSDEKYQGKVNDDKARHKASPTGWGFLVFVGEGLSFAGVV